MPTDKDFKRLIRQRMAATGERYTEALTRLAVASGLANQARMQPSSVVSQRGRWVELLGDPDQNQTAFGRLRELPAEDLRPLAIAATRHVNPRIRRRSCQLLDDLALTPESISALEQCAVDPDPRVRRAALHTLACEHCKPDGACLDQRLIAERAASDRSAKVRRGVAMGLSWNPKHSDDWAVALATRLLSDPSSEIRRYAGAALDRIERQRRGDLVRQDLPEALRRKTDRHPGKWVAITSGDIVAVDPGPSWRRDHTEADLYFVAPTGQSASN